ncbi:MAG: hypothetical protein CW335_05005, partial [Clostridiales bacterium]|nr:hypothetical protein [Clostridiales bacterium]
VMEREPLHRFAVPLPLAGEDKSAPHQSHVIARERSDRGNLSVANFRHVPYIGEVQNLTGTDCHAG